MPVQCFLIHPTDECAIGLRRYHTSKAIPYPGQAAAPECPGTGDFYHAAINSIGRDAVVWETDANHRYYRPFSEAPETADPRWPSKCANCDYEFLATSDAFQLSSHLIYKADDGREFILHSKVTELDVPPVVPGAMWDADWIPWKGPDGKSLMVVLPDGHQWNIDAQANNCSRKDDSLRPGKRQHWCWVRHGEPPNITVDKNGPTCQAGAGSIASKGWHGFLRDGQLVP